MFKRLFGFTFLLVVVATAVLTTAFAQENAPSGGTSGLGADGYGTIPVYQIDQESGFTPLYLGTFFQTGPAYQVNKYNVIKPTYDVNRYFKFKPLYEIGSPAKPVADLRGRPFVCDIV